MQKRTFEDFLKPFPPNLDFGHVLSCENKEKDMFSCIQIKKEPNCLMNG